MRKVFKIGDLVRYNADIPYYVPNSKIGLGIIVEVGVVDVRVYSMTQKKEVVIRGASCVVLSPANRKGKQ